MNEQNFLSVDEIIVKIQKQEHFQATVRDGSFSVAIKRYEPLVNVSLHSGHNLRSELWENCLLCAQERRFEEDPHTDAFIKHTPIHLIVHDSRYEYDLNRTEKKCIYDVAWGKTVWRYPLKDQDREAALMKHRNFYKLITCLILKIEQLFPLCTLIDLHSFNYSRRPHSTHLPVFDLGVDNLDYARSPHKEIVDFWQDCLSEVSRDLQTPSSVGINQVFCYGGYLHEYIKANFTKTLCIPTEIKKIYCEEETGIINQQVFWPFKKNLAKAFLKLLGFIPRL